MSKFSTKCDFYDMIEIHGIEYMLTCNIYNSPSELVPLKITQPRDLIPYYPRIVAISITAHDGPGNIWLSSESYVERHEREMLEAYRDDAKRMYKKFKRGKITQDEAASVYYNECYKKIFDKMLVYGPSTGVEGIHIDFCNKMRMDLFEEMMNNGYPLLKSAFWCFPNDTDTAWKLIKERESSEELPDG